MSQTPALPTACDNVTQTPVVPTTAEITRQTDSYFDISEIPPEAPRPNFFWRYSYPQFHCLLREYPDVHSEDFVTYGILQSQPHRGTQEDWGQVAAVLSHMMGGRLAFIA